MMSEVLKIWGASSNVGEHKLPHLVELGLTQSTCQNIEGLATPYPPAPLVPTSLAERTT